MRCPRLSHFVRFNPNGTVSRCGHMIDAPQFNSLEEMDESLWLRNVKLYMHKGLWPKECIRCKQTESINGTSIRLNAINFDKIQTKEDYLTVGGVLDNICNSACQTCNENLSTKIGALKSKTYVIVDNSEKFWKLPLDRVVHLDINGGEPSASKNYRKILSVLPPTVQSVRVNTNCALIIEELERLVEQGTKVTVTVSLDGIGRVHEYLRWPIPWEKFYTNLMTYKSMNVDLNLWTTVSALNVADFDNITAFAKSHGINHSFGLLSEPKELDIRYKNTFTNTVNPLFADQQASLDNNQEEILAYIQKQDQLRGINYKDFL